jgi:shikimate dehydrogenase
MDHYFVIGNPVEHSYSPFIHKRFALATGQEIDYTRVLCPLESFEPTLRKLADSGARGCSVTVPFKFEARRLATKCSQRATLASAVNTLSFDADSWTGDNTDGVGLVRDIALNAGVAIAKRRVLVIGAGGAAAGVLGPLLSAGPSALVLANRTLEKARALVDGHQDVANATGVTLTAAALDNCGEGFDVVVNASASSLLGVDVPVAAKVLRAGTLALDMMYGLPAQPFLQWARTHGAVARDGLGMLVEQAAQAFFLWRAVQPETAPVLATLRQELGYEGNDGMAGD